MDFENLKKYYKKVLKCKSCRKQYGSDEKKDNGFCPLCERIKKIKPKQ